jgi:hypothetical protein
MVGGEAGRVKCVASKGMRDSLNMEEYAVYDLSLRRSVDMKSRIEKEKNSMPIRRVVAANTS